MGRRQRRVATEIDLDRRSKPAQVEAVARLIAQDECRLRLVHLHGDVLHPLLVARLGKNADAGGISAEGAIGEGIDDHDRLTHAAAFLSDFLNGSRDTVRWSNPWLLWRLVESPGPDSRRPTIHAPGASHRADRQHCWSRRRNISS